MNIKWSPLLLILAIPCVISRAQSCDFGTLQSDPIHAKSNVEAGLLVATVSLSWERLEPRRNQFSASHFDEARARISDFRAAGQQVVIDLGMQYPPAWIFEIPNSSYLNQFGDRFDDMQPGMHVPNFVFNAAVRERLDRYIEAVFKNVGTEFYAVRLGGGWFGELNFPPATFKGRTNCYWAFDRIAQGNERGLAQGLIPCPVQGWQPGSASDNHTSARQFIDWYLDALKNYHDWQIATVRRSYKGRLMMMYPSWGIRPGQLDAAIQTDLAGETSAEKNGELQRGYDFARFIAGIRDPNVVIHCTWLDGHGNDASPNPQDWSPARFLSALAQAHRPVLSLSGENTGGGGMEALQLCLRRARELRLSAFFYAFEPHLFDGAPPELADFKQAIEATARDFSE
jgi:hypothetical protein